MPVNPRPGSGRGHPAHGSGPIKFPALVLHFAVRSSCLTATGLGARGAPFIDLSFGALGCKGLTSLIRPGSPYSTHSRRALRRPTRS